MEPSSSSSAGERGGAVKAILWGGLSAGVLDLAFAFCFHAGRGMKPLTVMQAIAGGVLGQAAFRGGMGSAVLGVGLHFVIALGAAVVFWAASRRWTKLLRHAWVSGPVFGAGVHFFMYMVVMPLSAYHAKAWPPSVAAWPLMAHLFLVGLPIALAARRFSR